MQEENKTDYDLADDLAHFINNNSEFYKHAYLPVVKRFATLYKNHMHPKMHEFQKVVNQAYGYYKEFVEQKNPEIDLPAKLPPEVFAKACNILYQEQIKHIEQESEGNAMPQDSVSEEIRHIVKLAGVGSTPYKPVSLEDINQQSSNKATYMKENNIQPGTREWFDLWFPLDDSKFQPKFRGRK